MFPCRTDDILLIRKVRFAQGERKHVTINNGETFLSSSESHILQNYVL